VGGWHGSRWKDGKRIDVRGGERLKGRLGFFFEAWIQSKWRNAKSATHSEFPWRTRQKERLVARTEMQRGLEMKATSRSRSEEGILTDVRDKVEGQGVSKEFVLSNGSLWPSHHLLGPVKELLHSLCTSTGSCLVRGHQHLLEAVLLVEGEKGHDADRRRAVGVGDDLPGAGLCRVGIDLGDAERDILLVAECRRVVDDDGAIVAANMAEFRV
jgi:hypothetical protein